MNINTNIFNNASVSSQNKMGFAELQKKQAKLTEKFNRLNELIVNPKAMDTEPLCTKKAAIDQEVMTDYKKSLVDKYKDENKVNEEKNSLLKEINKIKQEQEDQKRLNAEDENRGKEINFA